MDSYLSFQEFSEKKKKDIPGPIIIDYCVRTRIQLKQILIILYRAVGYECGEQMI